MKVIIAGTRTFNDYELMCHILNHELTKHDEIVSGVAQGADWLGERYADEHGIAKKLFPADWHRHGKSAGYIRNAEMAKYADMLIAFWDGKSRGTKMMIDLAKKDGLKVMVVDFR